MIDQIFSNHVVTDCILQVLTLPEILSCALVCKTWNNVTNEFLRRRRVCLLKCDIEDVEKLDILRKLLENHVGNSNHPFNGVHFVVGKLLGFMPKRFEIKICLEAIFTVTTIKYITITYKQEHGFPRGDYNAFHIWFFNILRRRLPKNELEHLQLIGQMMVPWQNFTKVNTPNPTLDGFTNLQTFESDYVPNLAGRVCESRPETFIHGCPVLTDFRAALEVKEFPCFYDFDKLSLVRWIHLNFSQVVDEELLESMEEEELEIPLEVLSLYNCSWTPEQIQCVRRLIKLSKQRLRKVILNGYDFKHEYKHYPRLETISEVVVYHYYTQREYITDSHDKMILTAFPNATIFHNVLGFG